MSVPLLAAKLRLPTVSPNLVPRPRLTAQLADGLTRPLTLVSAPAGSGKTTLLGEWRETAEGREYPLAWLSLDEDDNDSARFLTYLAAALDNLDLVSAITRIGRTLRSTDGLNLGLELDVRQGRNG